MKLENDKINLRSWNVWATLIHIQLWWAKLRDTKLMSAQYSRWKDRRLDTSFIIHYKVKAFYSTSKWSWVILMGNWVRNTY